MKKNHSTTKSLTRKYLPVIISVIIIAVLISSCCVPEEARVGKTNCNCTDKKYAVTKEPAYNYTQAALVLTDNNEIRDAIKPAVYQLNNNSVFISANVRQVSEMKSKKPPFGIKSIDSKISAGANVSTAGFRDSDLKKKAGVGFQFGVSSNYHFGNSFSLNPGIRFRQNRFSATEGDGSYSTETEYKYNFISTPILANFRLGPKVNFAIGPELNYLLSATSKISSGSYGGETEKITERSTRLGLGLESSLSVRVSKRLGFGLSINKGLNNLDKKTESDYGSYEGNIKSMTHFSLTIDYLLCLMETAEWLRNRK